MIAEGALTVRHLEASTPLFSLAAELSVSDATRQLEEAGFDTAPVEDVDLYRYVTLEFLRQGIGKVEDVARPIGAHELVTADLGLADGIAALGRHPFRFVLSGERISGIITWSDLQKPPVGMVVLAMAIAAEPALDELIVDEDPNWENNLGPAAKGKVEQIYSARCRTNTEVSRVRCMQIDHRLALIGKSKHLRTELGYPGQKAWRSWEKRAKDLRNVLAHGGNVLEVEPRPTDAVALVQEVRDFAERAWSLAAAVRPRTAEAPSDRGQTPTPGPCGGNPRASDDRSSGPG